jgi:PAS domain S-box-containing protein
MSEFMELPVRARAWIVAVWIAALVLVAIRLPDLSTWNTEDVVACFALSAIAAILEQFTVRMSHGPEAENYSLTDALWVPTLIFAKPGVLTLAVLFGIAAGQLLRGWRWYKVAYNVAQFVVSITVAEVVFSFFHVSSSLSLMVWLAASIAMLSYFALNELFISFVISLIDGESLQTLLVLPDGLNLLHAAGNLTIGLLAALVWSTGPVGIPLLIAPMVLVFLAYRGWLHAEREEEQAKERERMQTLYEAGRELSGPIDVGYDYKPFLVLVRRMLDASAVELVLLNDGARIYNSEVGLMVNLPPEDRPPTAEELVSTRPGLTTFMASIDDAPTVSSILAVHRATLLSSAEGSLVEALASQLKVRNENERLFHETVEQRSHLSDVIGNTSDGILVVSADGVIVSWNPAMEHITGIARAGAAGRGCDEVLGLHLEDDGPEGRTFVPLRVDEAGSHDVLLTRTDGSERWIRYTSNPMPSREGGVKSFVIVARDVTAELETEQLKSDFVATVSHELRSPLTPLKGFVRALRDGLIEETPEARHEYYEIMWRAVERLERLINDLLDVSRVEAGKLDLESKPFNATELLDGCIRHIRGEFPDRVVDFVHPTDAVCVLADPFRVDQIVQNLLSNAFKYSTAGSTVQLSLTVDGNRVIVAVSNEGEGIAPADQPHVFDRFFRTRTGLQREVGGAGLGLFICRRLVEAMGSQIELESAPGEGCTFTFWLPRVATKVDGARVERRPIETLT